MLAEAFDKVYYIIYICYIFLIIVLFHAVICCRLLYYYYYCLKFHFCSISKGPLCYRIGSAKKNFFDFRGRTELTPFCSRTPCIFCLAFDSLRLECNSRAFFACKAGEICILISLPHVPNSKVNSNVFHF